MAELKTKQTETSVEDFLSEIADEKIRRDSERISALMEKATGAKPKMWGDSIVGFGSRQLRRAGGRELDWMLIGFAPRKTNITLYIMDGFERYDELLAKLGKHKTGKSCLHIKRLSDVDETVLTELIVGSVANVGKS